MTALELLSRLDGVRSRGTGRWSARCPFHEDHSPSLSIGEGADRILLHCFALCENQDIVAALGLTMADLFFVAPTPHGQRPTPKPVKVDRVALAFRFELAALDRRLRAARVMRATTSFPVDGLDDTELDRLMTAVARAHGDMERVELFERIADALRWKEYQQRERMVSHAV
jgi:hypothetical protein